ncbi:hypothetical protein [Streptomyces glaucescens]|uniref:hypothetical protein n=1 Tax=Streptomyces glaucescens TaxID=1907 RepID=UPI0011816B12|nr:hypothetical protein [Streptomyces glaucescens]
MQADLQAQVRHALSQAGFHVVDEDAGDGGPGLVVTAVSAGVLVTWRASDRFTSLVREQSRASGDSMQAIVHAAVSGLLIQAGAHR